MGIRPVGRPASPRRRHDWAAHLALSVAVLLISAPLIFALLKATQTSSDVTSARLLPGGAFFENLGSVWAGAHLGRYMLNSLVVALSVTVGKTALALLAALAFVYFRFPLRGAAFVLVLLSLMLPTEVLIVALFDVVSRDLRWADTYAAIIVPFLASATGTFLFRQHFMNIPVSLADAARIDGCGPLRFLTHILVPMSLNTVGALAVIQFVYGWDQYLWPLVIMQHDDRQVVQVGLRRLIEVGGQTDWGAVMAGAIVTMLPPLLVFTLLQEQFSKGFALTEDK
ncbi:carbohydrate ABC transporter permease [Deinococcus sp. Leaf326]|jgi:sn-glycerol 3-phosphate transport system permease protein|uniref:carbohydrate ABC transporter permease n=2 Tax=Deinococcus TaxID=1298 RepID=UPI0006FB2346|nr:carbohydrate ABC transporter permease [Deinococcus sp. Leaf326]KQR04744.1 glycerol-3-phosphate ABC transporter permease [Deinococcus sp. Leaf326]